jgi:hypothetical protein
MRVYGKQFAWFQFRRVQVDKAASLSFEPAYESTGLRFSEIGG